MQDDHFSYKNMGPQFERLVSVLSLITNHTRDYIYENHGHLITQWNRNILILMP